MSDSGYAIEVNNVYKSFKVYLDKGNTLKERSIFSRRRKYQNREVLKNISFKVKKGETVGLIGHNGCGKSTTLKLLTRIMYPDRGDIIVDGRVSSLIELGAGFHPDMSGRENIYINASIFGLTKKEIDERLDDIIAFSELEEFIDNPVRTYSSGMYMRLAFAVAINVNADILLIDEILSVGDENFQVKCFEKMRELKAAGVTIVLVTHDAGTVKTFCDRAIWINDGEIKADDKAIKIVDTYLAYMNEVRMEYINEQKAKSQKPYDENDEDITMDPNSLHFGNRKAVILSCNIINKEGEGVSAISSDDPFILKYHYKINDPSLEEIIIGMGIFNIDGLWIYGTNTQLANIHIDVKGKKEGQVIFECEPLRLLTNKYILQCSIIEIDSTPCDYYNEYSQFNVVNSSKESGFITYQTNWKVVE